MTIAHQVLQVCFETCLCESKDLGIFRAQCTLCSGSTTRSGRTDRASVTLFFFFWRTRGPTIKNGSQRNCIVLAQFFLKSSKAYCRTGGCHLLVRSVIQGYSLPFVSDSLCNYLRCSLAEVCALQSGSSGFCHDFRSFIRFHVCPQASMESGWYAHKATVRWKSFHCNKLATPILMSCNYKPFLNYFQRITLRNTDFLSHWSSIVHINQPLDALIKQGQCYLQHTQTSSYNGLSFGLLWFQVS